MSEIVSRFSSSREHLNDHRPVFENCLSRIYDYKHLSGSKPNLLGRSSGTIQIQTK
jgi:hypothetical protein